MTDRADSFDWSGGHPALDLVNTLDERPSDSPIEKLVTYRDLVRFARRAGLITTSMSARLLRLDGRSGAGVVVERARELRERFHDVLAAAHSRRPPRRRDLDAISAAVQAAHAARVLVASPARGLARHVWSPASAPDIPLHACSLAIERLVLEAEPGRVRKCGASDCDVYYLDTSKSRLRQWCSMTSCGNREKQRRWRATGSTTRGARRGPGRAGA